MSYYKISWKSENIFFFSLSFFYKLLFLTFLLWKSENIPILFPKLRNVWRKCPEIRRKFPSLLKSHYLIILESLDQFLIGHQVGYFGPRVMLVSKLHGGPGGVQLLQDLLHAHLLDGLVHDATHLVLKVVQVEGQEVGERCRLVHDEFDLGGGKVVVCVWVDDKSIVITTTSSK